MAIEYVSQAGPTAGPASGTSTAIPSPANKESGDLLVCVALNFYGELTWPAGWTVLTSGYWCLGYRFWESGGLGSFSHTNYRGNEGCAYTCCFRGVADYGGRTGSGSNATSIPLSATTDAADCLVLGLRYTWTYTSTGTPLLSGEPLTLKTATKINIVRYADWLVGYKIQGEAGGTGTVNFNVSATSGGSQSQLMWFRPQVTVRKATRQFARGLRY